MTTAVHVSACPTEADARAVLPESGQVAQRYLDRELAREAREAASTTFTPDTHREDA